MVDPKVNIHQMTLDVSETRNLYCPREEDNPQKLCVLICNFHSVTQLIQCIVYIYSDETKQSLYTRWHMHAAKDLALPNSHLPTNLSTSDPCT